MIPPRPAQAHFPCEVTENATHAKIILVATQIDEVSSVLVLRNSTIRKKDYLFRLQPFRQKVFQECYEAFLKKVNSYSVVCRQSEIIT